ncbi:MAG: transcription antitermination factor NusB [Betaproteobacteria bacterium]|nr:transcription antitermination factor NusB [Betaproteobacteria bacterium]
MSAESQQRPRTTARGGRRRSRELAVQGIYQWLLNAAEPAAIQRDLQQSDQYDQADVEYLSTLIRGAVEQADSLRQTLAPQLDRDVNLLSPVEHAILLVGAFELKTSLDVPYKVVINEAVELAKVFGGTDGHKYVNGVLDRVGPALRPHDPAAKARGT